MNNVISNLIKISRNDNNNSSTSSILVSSLNSFVSDSKNSNYWNNSNDGTVPVKTGSSSSSNSTLNPDTLLWTAIPPSYCPTGVMESNYNTTDRTNNNNNNNKIQIRQSTKYADKVAIVTMVIGQRKFLEKRLGLWIQSIRRRGSWLGPIVLFVSNNDTINFYNQKNFTTTIDHKNVYWIPVTDNMIHHSISKPFMKYKRFKTQFFDLISSSSLPVANIEYLHYMDADILVGNSLVDFWDRILWMNHKNGDVKSYPWYFFHEQGKHPAMFQAKDENWTLYHTGVSIWHRIRSKECLHAWQQRFDSDLFATDQAALLDVLYNNSQFDNNKDDEYCPVGIFPNTDLMMPNIGPMKNGKRTTFVHFTHGRLKRIQSHMNKYEKCVLLLDTKLNSE